MPQKVLKTAVDKLVKENIRKKKTKQDEIFKCMKQIGKSSLKNLKCCKRNHIFEIIFLKAELSNNFHNATKK